MIVYEENTKRIVIPSGLGNLTGLMEAEAQAMYNSGRTDGYNEGVEDGKSIQDRKLTESVTFNENGEYDADYGYKKVIVDVDKQWDEGFEVGYESGYTDGYTSGYTDGYTSGYTDGVNIKAIKIEGKFPNAYSATSKVSYFGDFWINGVFVERLEITHERLYPLFKVYGRNESERDYRNFWISGFSASISTVQSIDLEVASNLYDIDLDGDEFDMTFNGIPIHITNWTRELIWTAQLPNQSPRTIYIYHWDITPITPTDYEIGYTDGYASGYTDGQASCPECSGSTDCSSAITEAFESGYTNGYASGYSAGQADCESGCNDYLECRTTVSFAEDTVIPAPSVGVGNYIFYNLDMGYTFVYGAEGWEHNGENLHSLIFNEVTLPAGTYNFRSILKQNGEWYTSDMGGMVFAPNETIPGGVIGSRFYYNESEQ